MTKLLTPEELKLKFQREKEIRIRRKEREKRKQREIYKKASESIKKALADKLPTVIKIKPQEQNKQPQIKSVATYHVYNSNNIERYSSEEDLYNTWEEIKEAEERGEGELNWDLLFKLIDKLRKTL